MSTDKSLSSLQKQLQDTLDAIHAYCVKNKETVAVAESVTSGCLQLILSTAESARDFFQGGITAYNCSQKAIHLNIEPINADNCNCVDPDIAFEMAQNVCKLFRAQIGIGITGYATKVPEEGIGELFAYVAIVRNGEVLYRDRISPDSEEIEAQWSYADKVVRILGAHLDKTV